METLSWLIIGMVVLFFGMDTLLYFVRRRQHRKKLKNFSHMVRDLVQAIPRPSLTEKIFKDPDCFHRRDIFVLCEGLKVIVDAYFCKDGESDKTANGLCVTCEFPDPFEDFGEDFNADDDRDKLAKFSIENHLQQWVEKKFSLPLKFSPAKLAQQNLLDLAIRIDRIANVIDMLWHGSEIDRLRMRDAIVKFRVEKRQIQQDADKVFGPGPSMSV